MGICVCFVVYNVSIPPEKQFENTENLRQAAGRKLEEKKNYVVVTWFMAGIWIPIDSVGDTCGAVDDVNNVDLEYCANFICCPSYGPVLYMSQFKWLSLTLFGSMLFTETILQYFQKFRITTDYVSSFIRLVDQSCRSIRWESEVLTNYDRLWAQVYTK